MGFGFKQQFISTSKYLHNELAQGYWNGGLQSMHTFYLKV